jgi:hypothetical protein
MDLQRRTMEYAVDLAEERTLERMEYEQALARVATIGTTDLRRGMVDDRWQPLSDLLVWLPPLNACSAGCTKHIFVPFLAG